jgi:hypothetical protein
LVPVGAGNQLADKARKGERGAILGTQPRHFTLCEASAGRRTVSLGKVDALSSQLEMRSDDNVSGFVSGDRIGADRLFKDANTLSARVAAV